MTAPTPSPRGTPDGKYLGDGYQTLVTFGRNPNIAFWEKSITPPGVDGGNPNETDSMFNDVWTTKSPRTLKTLTTCSMTAFYDPKVYTEIVGAVNVRDTVTIHFPDGSTLAFYGYLKTFKPSALEHGKPPEATLDFEPTNQDPVDCTEEGPTYTAGPGTGARC